jgi:hypothetical protein
MFEIFIWISIGAFIGWNFPQPLYARWIQDMIQEKLGIKKDDQN